MGIILLDRGDTAFPRHITESDDGVVAVSDYVCAKQIVPAYRQGIFPWPKQEDVVLWTSPDPRSVLIPADFVVSKSLRRTIRSGRFHYKIDADFRTVVNRCASVRRKHQRGTWITDDIVDAYCGVHAHGSAHSFETYQNGELVGGLYGICIGRQFVGESMFHTAPDASKFAMAVLVVFCMKNNFRLIDCQIPNPHLTSLGAINISRRRYLAILHAEAKKTFDTGNWSAHATADISPLRLLDGAARMRLDDRLRKFGNRPIFHEQK